MPYPCFLCKAHLIWDNDVEGGDIMHDEESTVSFYHCPECKAGFRVIIPLL